MLALSALARAYGKGSVPISQIAKTEKIPQRFLEGILLQLKNKGWLDSTRGKAGGYFLIKRPTDISLEEIVLEFEGSLCMITCFCDKMYQPCEFCKDESACKIRKAFESVYLSAQSILRNTSLKSLIE